MASDSYSGNVFRSANDAGLRPEKEAVRARRPLLGRLNRWQQRGRSPLARKIIAFNLIALGILTTGILFISQVDSQVISLKQQTLRTQAALIAVSIAKEVERGGFEGFQHAPAVEFISQISLPTGARVEIFNTENSLLVTGPIPPDIEERYLEQQGDIISSAVNRFWNLLNGLATPDGSQSDTRDVAESRRDLGAQAIVRSTAVGRVILDTTGGRMVAVAAPIASNGRTFGSVVMSTFPGEIDSVVREGREPIVQISSLAFMVSIVLSLFLASSIASPLRELSASADSGSALRGGKLNPALISFPDYSSRHDEIGDLSRALRNMTTALTDRIEQNEVFAADVAHELKNPITSMRSAIETLDYAKSEDDRKKLQEVMQSDVTRMDRLVTDISNASRLDAELASAEMTSIDLSQMLQVLSDYQHDLAQAKGVSVHFHPPQYQSVVYGHEGRIAQVFVNLITNAVSFSEKGQAVEIRIEDAPAHMLRVVVDDMGPGIPPENLDDIFRRFYSSRPETQFGDHSGLGLAISRQIVEAHGGNIWAENRKAGQGARFIVELPA